MTTRTIIRTIIAVFDHWHFPNGLLHQHTGISQQK